MQVSFNSLYSHLETQLKEKYVVKERLHKGLGMNWTLTEVSLISHWLAQDRELGALRVQISALLTFFLDYSATFANHKMSIISLPCRKAKAELEKWKVQ